MGEFQLAITCIDENENLHIYEEIVELDDCYWWESGQELNTGQLYRELQREYGRCKSKVYVDEEDGPRAIGWYFVKHVPYDDDYSHNPKTFLQGVWVTVLREVEPAREREFERVSI